MNDEVKVKKPRVVKPVIVLVASKQGVVQIVEVKAEDLTSYVTKNVKGGASGIKDGLGTLNSGESFAMFRGTMISPKVTVKF